MVLQVATHPRHIGHHRQALRLQQGRVAHARQLQYLRRPHGPGAQQHLAPGLHGAAHALLHQLHPAAHRQAVVSRREQQAAHLRTGPHRQVAALFADGPQKRLGRIPTPAAALVHLEIAHAQVVATVEVGHRRNALLLRRQRKRVQHVPAQALLLYPPFTAVAVQRGKSLGILVGGLRRIQPVMVFVGAKVGQAMLPTPGLVARGFGPLRVIIRLPAHVDHAIDAGAAAQGFATRVQQRPAIQPRRRVGAVAPVGARVVDAVQVTHRNVDPRIVVRPARLQQQNTAAFIRTEPVGQQAARGACADDDVVESGGVHGGEDSFLAAYRGRPASIHRCTTPRARL